MRKEGEYTGKRVMGMGVSRKKETRKAKEEVDGLLYGAETWAVRKAQDKKLDTVEIGFLSSPQDIKCTSASAEYIS